MKTEREIWEKIEELETSMETERIKEMCKEYSKESRNNKLESYMCVIDALLWVVGDRSGKPI